MCSKCRSAAHGDRETATVETLDAGYGKRMLNEICKFSFLVSVFVDSSVNCLAPLELA